MSGGQHGGPGLEDDRCLARVHDGRCQKPDSRVAVLLVVPCPSGKPAWRGAFDLLA